MDSAVTDVADHDGWRARSCAAWAAAVAFVAAAMERSTVTGTVGADRCGNDQRRRAGHLVGKNVPRRRPPALLAAVTADDERVFRARGGDVEQAIDLGLEILLLPPARASPSPQARRADARAAALPFLLDAKVAARRGAVADDPDVHARFETSERVREEHDRGLQPLRLVQVHQPHDITTTRLERQ